VQRMIRTKTKFKFACFEHKAPDLFDRNTGSA
jgi:hypothetical protein